VIIGNLDLLGRLLKADRIAKELCEEARDGALRCADLIRLLLAFARRQPLHPRRIDVNELAKRTGRLLERTLGENITVSLHTGKLMASVLADPAQLEAALTNLANNARDAMPRGGRLDITTKMLKLDEHYTALYRPRSSAASLNRFSPPSSKDAEVASGYRWCSGSSSNPVVIWRFIASRATAARSAFISRSRAQKPRILPH
jgi:hypothetical protein